ncbi:golgin subfamily A member 6-like protein 22 isoform X4 [Mytilus edulis]|uniref:golgin subfamily A member 6-like protein 22 isoform X4 n=1 Tax=Mytilus edulis TaxID=6550 RepID=UPI0039EDE950
MNYGLLNFKAQNGKPQIFWSNEQSKKQERKFGYKSRDQRFTLRQYPTDMTADSDNLLQPIEQPEEEKPKKPAKNFIKKNRETMGKKATKNKENGNLVTLTQEQLNAILASVGKVASGREDALRISMDSDKHVIKVESPGREGEGEHRRRHRDRKKKDEDQSIFALVDDNKKSRDNDDRRRDRRDRTPERSDSGDRYRSRKHSGERDHHRKHSGDREYRNNSSERYREHSSDRHRKHSSDRYRRDSRERRRSRTPSRERYRTPSRERRRHSPDDRSRERRRHSPDERYRHSHDNRSRERRPSPEDRYKRDSSEGRHRKHTPERVDHKSEKPKEENPPSPREIAGIPVTLPWKHMTKAERRRKEEEEKRRNFQDLESKSLNKNFKKDDYRRESRDDYQRRDDDRISDFDRGSSLKTSSLPPPAPATAKTSLGELKRRQWERERADSTNTGEFQPWGKPGAGAPIRTKSGNVAADYGKRKDNEHELETVEEEPRQRRHYSSPPRERRGEPTYSEPLDTVRTQEGVPAAMRSSIVFGQGADSESAMRTKELERQKWVQELDKQREEKQKRELKEMNIIKASEETWADKFSNPYRPAPLPDQSVKQYGPEEHLITKENILDTRRTSSAPNQFPDDDEPKTHIRGQNVFMDSQTQKEQEEKRKRHLEHQTAIMEQVKEKQRLKQMEKERKIKEDMEEEMKLQKEREKQQNMLNSDIQKNKAREVRRQQQVENLKAAMDEANENAQREKSQKRMQHLEEGGHDVSHLKANLQEKQLTARYPAVDTVREPPTTIRDQFFTSQHYYSHNMADILTGGRLAKLTPRATEPTYVPGLNLEVSPRPIQTDKHSDKSGLALEPYTENRVLTPSQYRYGQSPKREFGTQTGNIPLNNETGRRMDQRTYREMTDVDIVYKVSKGKKVRVKSATKEEKMPRRQPPNQKRSVIQKEDPKPRETDRRSRSRKKELWNYQNPAHKHPKKQSEKDPIQHKRQASEHRRRIREQELMAMVEMNKDRIPTERLSRCGSHSDGETTPRTDRLCHRHKSHSPVGQPEVNRLVINRSRSRSPEQSNRALVPYNRERSPSPSVSVVRTDDRLKRAPSPPVPALKHKIGGEGGLDHRGKQYKYGDTNPVTYELGDNDFVPFTRTVEILDPAQATNPLPLSRETTKLANARKAYIKGMKPGNYGNRVDVYEDRIRLPGESRNNDKDPITNPSLVKNHPTQRQDQILNQLSSLKESLIQRQRELETFSPTDLE